ncbi:mitochondrial K+-H+ exchange-related-domain-containing protein [Gymnopilus junonius]|uniref:Mitochondrial K+-H+ exchange-related-domain-containing protein n=1 Tax=Gymnopilus junonius TaxID=109634 RepID=A0A9P5TID4_GYMJU|nr:mitochondrial K+-H+ exchange-related-domain-containing protein [Gymnopilus junonius]
MVAALRTMRIVAVPLTRPSRRIQYLNNGQLSRYTYYQIQLPPKKLPASGVVNWATQKAADIWAGFGKAQGGWKLKTHQIGEKLIDRIEFEELELKKFDPSLAPSLKQLEKSPLPLKFPLLYPPSILSPTTALSDLRDLVELRIPRHRKGFFLWIFLSPFTAPFMLIPIIPNLPFFFCVWRAWSHYRAYKASKYLQTLLEHNLIEPQGSELLDQVYRTYRISPPLNWANVPSSTKTTSAVPTSAATEPSSPPKSKSSKLDFASADPEYTLLLGQEAVPALLSVFELQNDAIVSNDLNRAIDQTRTRLSIKS